VLVTVRYIVRSEAEEAFLEAMEPVRRTRLQTGATSCQHYPDGADPSTFLLVQIFPTWEEHLRQHTDRLTNTDREHEELAHSFAVEVTSAHLFPTTRRTEQP
jgi:hypothetical protein